MTTENCNWRQTASLAIGLGMALAAPAAATSIVNDPFSFAQAASLGNPEFVSTNITNGVQGPVSGIVSSSGSALATSSDSGFTNSAGATSNTGGTSGATANLRAGTVAAYGFNGTGGGNTRTISEARIKDTVFFSNTSGGVVYLPFTFSFDGSITDPNDFGASATSILSLGGAIGTCPDGSYGGCFGDYSYKLQSGGSPNQTITIGYMGDGTYNGVQQGGAFFFNAPDNVDLDDYTVMKDWNQGGGYYNTVVSSVLALPEGASRIGFDLRVIIDCWVYPGAQCDFTQTSKFAFGDPVPGLSITSASGVFLVQSPISPGAVPEPTSWALMIAGFGLAGGAIRRRRSAISV
jgi:hypothetical protein